ncbi:MAG: hypothetical protein DWQ31_16590 [Planctomycetota bacterium]|nr:MAG: hypothetical protein DWQ31_16590 [Planctomycetota bacterium]
MPAFLYFVPDHNTPVSLDDLRRWGLDYAFERVPYHAHVQGPTGSGTLLVDDRRLEPLTPTYRPEEQTWKKQPGRDFWVGWYNSRVPSMPDLERVEQLPGDRVELADGNRWLVPLVRFVDADSTPQIALPAYLDVDDDGKFIRGDTVEQYAWLVTQTTPFWEAYHDAWTAAIEHQESLPEDASLEEQLKASQFTIDCPTLVADAVAVLSANYRIGQREAMAMKLFRTDSGAGEILKAACDTATANLFLKKKVPAPSG